MGYEETFQDIKVKFATTLHSEALALCAEYNLKSARAAALMFDIKVQNGTISDPVKALIQSDFSQLDHALPADQAEVARMQIIANRRANAAAAQWREDLRTRPLVTANGAGVVHGTAYNLETQFAIGLDPAV